MTIQEFRDKAKKSIEHFTETLKTIRTGRANPSLIENLMVDSYGSKMPLYQVASIGAPEPRVLSVSVWDKSLVPAIETAIKNSDLGVNPNVDGTLIRLNIPPMSEERRKELVKVVGKYAEETKVSFRNLRHEYLADLKRRKDEDKIPENDVKNEEEQIDNETKKLNTEVDGIAESKQKELMEI